MKSSRKQLPVAVFENDTSNASNNDDGSIKVIPVTTTVYSPTTTSPVGNRQQKQHHLHNHQVKNQHSRTSAISIVDGSGSNTFICSNSLFIRWIWRKCITIQLRQPHILLFLLLGMCYVTNVSIHRGLFLYEGGSYGGGGGNDDNDDSVVSKERQQSAVLVGHGWFQSQQSVVDSTVQDGDDEDNHDENYQQQLLTQQQKRQRRKLNLSKALKRFVNRNNMGLVKTLQLKQRHKQMLLFESQHSTPIATATRSNIHDSVKWILNYNHYDKKNDTIAQTKGLNNITEQTNINKLQLHKNGVDYNIISTIKGDGMRIDDESSTTRTTYQDQGDNNNDDTIEENEDGNTESTSTVGLSEFIQEWRSRHNNSNENDSLGQVQDDVAYEQMLEVKAQAVRCVVENHNNEEICFPKLVSQYNNNSTEDIDSTSSTNKKKQQQQEQQQQHRSIVFVHIGKAGGETVKDAIRLGCELRNPRKKQRCLSTLPNSSLSNAVHGYLHGTDPPVGVDFDTIGTTPTQYEWSTWDNNNNNDSNNSNNSLIDTKSDGDDDDDNIINSNYQPLKFPLRKGPMVLRDATTFLYVLRSPLDRTISWYSYVSPGNCNRTKSVELLGPVLASCRTKTLMNRNQYMIRSDNGKLNWHKIFFETCFPTIEDFALSLSHYQPVHKVITIPNHIKSPIEPLQMNGANVDVDDEQQPPKELLSNDDVPSVADIRTRMILDSVLTNPKDGTKAAVVDCTRIGKYFTEGRGPIPKFGLIGMHMKANIQSYYTRTIAKYPNQEVLVVRTTSLWDDLKKINTNILSGTIDDFTMIDGTVQSHGSEHHNITRTRQLSNNATRQLCCALRIDMMHYKYILFAASNLNTNEKQVTFQKDLQKCGGFNTWTEFTDYCTSTTSSAATAQKG